MTPQNRVRTYLDPDAVGPLPRATFADDSDELSNARTMLRDVATTVEIRPEDVIEVFDPNRPRSVAPVGYDTAIVLPKRKLGPYVVAVVGAALALLLGAAVQSTRSAPPAAAAVAAPVAPPVQPAAAAATEAAPSQPAPAPGVTVGTLRIDPSAEGQRVFVDGVVLSATAALVRCGPHEVALGSPGRTRTIDVPCGGEVTVYR